MEGIFKNENVYVVIKDIEVRDDVNLNEIEDFVFSEDKDACLYGGRVILEYNKYGYTLNIDGIDIIDGSYLSPDLNLETICAYLNQIEHLGIDRFLNNYKEQIKELKKDIETTINKIDSNTGDGKRRISELIVKLEKIIFLICALSLNMNAGLENSDYINAYDNIINLFF